jgi:hypothetical protein
VGRRQQLPIGGIERLRQIDDDEHNVSVGESLIAALDALRFGDVSRGADAGCVDELNGDAVNRADLADGVARRPGGRGHDGAFLFKQAVEQTRFADVRPPEDGQRQAASNNFAVAIAFGQPLNLGSNRVEPFKDCGR